MFSLLKVSGGVILKRGTTRIEIVPEACGEALAVVVAGQNKEASLSIGAVGEAEPTSGFVKGGTCVFVVPVPDAPDYPGWYTLGSRVTQWTSTRKVCLSYA